VIARNLEMLAIASKARSRYAPSARLVYECLDIHRLLLSRDVLGGFLRAIEMRLWRGVDLLLTSSPAFIAKYFEPRGFPAPIRLVENKLALLDGAEERESSSRPPPGPPWRIGWFGAIRCRKSLQILSELARTLGGEVEIVIRGRPSEAVFPNFAADVAGLPHLHYGGLYRNPDDLPLIYGTVHFNWAIDYYESGQNSTWLLPNRLYEGTYYGAVPIALTGVATGEWLIKRSLGVVLDDPIHRALTDFFLTLDRGVYGKLVGALQSVPRTRFASDRADCLDLVQSLCQPHAAKSGAPS
jgi:succinoglycan biosynthesis protein ExoL